MTHAHHSHSPDTHEQAADPGVDHTRHAAEAEHVHDEHVQSDAVHHGHVPDTTSSWRQASSATLHCLTGCAIGEVLGLVIGTALGWSTVPTIVLAIVLAFFFGYSLTIRPVLRAGVTFSAALGIAFAADTLSITVMEIVDNAVILLVPGAMEAGLTSALFWGSLAAALAIAFVVTVPVNRWMIGRGKGHAVVHQYHHGHGGNHHH